MKRRIQTKKVLVASIGVAVVSYAVACSDGGSGSLTDDGGVADAKSDVPTSGNLMPPKDATSTDVQSDTSTPDALFEDVSSSGNLVPPPDDASVD
jgi:hypothetical protein